VTKGVKGQTEQPGRRLKTPSRGSIARCGARPFLRAGLCSVGLKLETCRQARIHPGSALRKGIRRRTVALNMCQGNGRSARREPSAWESSDLWVLVL
jgi:flagellar biosynthesis/type III secretory pathway chaperone